MFSAFLEAVFLAFPVTSIATVLGVAVGGYFFGTMPAFAGALLGLVGGGLLEAWLHHRAWSTARNKWLGIVLFCAIMSVIALAAILTR